jgi:hypothetical protein
MASRSAARSHLYRVHYEEYWENKDNYDIMLIRCPNEQA